MATHSSILAWRITWTEEPGRLQSMGSQRVEHNRAANTHTDGSVGKECTYNAGDTSNRSLGGEDPLEEEMAAHSSILAWEISWTEEPGRLQSMGLQRVGHDRETEHTLTLKNQEISQKNTDPWIFLKTKRNRDLVKLDRDYDMGNIGGNKVTEDAESCSPGQQSIPQLTALLVTRGVRQAAELCDPCPETLGPLLRALSRIWLRQGGFMVSIFLLLSAK